MADVPFAVLSASGIVHAALGLYLVTRRDMRLVGVLATLVGLAVLSLSIAFRSQSPCEVSFAQMSLHTDLTQALSRANTDLHQLQQELAVAQRNAREAEEAQAKAHAEADARAEAVAESSTALAKTSANLQEAREQLAVAQLAATEARQAELSARVAAETQIAAALTRVNEAESAAVAAKNAQTEAIARAEAAIREKIAAEKRAADALAEATRQAKATQAARKRSALYQRKYYRLSQSRKNLPKVHKTGSYSPFELIFGLHSTQ
jgi:hypothetical protein